MHTTKQETGNKQYTNEGDRGGCSKGVMFFARSEGPLICRQKKCG